ncbi:MAG: helix-turn-helix domain-containing protein [Frankiaceae bacterium]
MTADLGQRVIDLRRRKGLSQAELAAAAHITAAHLSYVEASKRRPSAAVVASLAEQLGTTVEHLTTGRGDEGRTVELNLRFAEVALGSGDPTTARERFAAAHEQAVVMGSAYDPERYEALLGLARADEALGRLDDAIAEFEALLDARDLPSSVSRVTVAVGLCRAYTHVGDLGRAIDLGEAALAEVGPLDTAGGVVSDERVELASTLMGAYYERGDLTRAQMLIDSVVVSAEASGSMRARGAAYWNAAAVAEARGQVRSAIKLADRAIALYGEIGHAFAVAALRGNAASYSLRLPDADLAAAEKQLRESIEGMAEAGGSPADLAWAEKELARCCLLAGRVSDAVVTARAALRRVPSVPLERARVLAVLAAALLAAGDVDEAVTAYEHAAVALESYGARRQAAPVWRELAAVLKAMGRESDTIVAFERMAAALDVPAVPIRPVAAAI